MYQYLQRREDGIAIIQNGDVSFMVAIPSRGRAERVVKHPFFALGNLFVHESEIDTYAATFARLGVQPGALIPHQVDGHLAKIRNVMLDKLRPEQEAFQMQLDDDYAGMSYLFTVRQAQVKVRNVRRIIDIFTHDYILARDMGTGLFCYAQTPTPWERHAFNPFRLRGWGMAACMGILDPVTLRFDENLRLKMDIDMCLQAIAHYKVLLQDMRFYGWCDETGARTGADTGGLANIRTTHAEQTAVRYLQKKWGEKVISYKGAKKRGLGLTVRARIPQSYDDCK